MLYVDFITYFLQEYQLQLESGNDEILQHLPATTSIADILNVENNENIEHTDMRNKNGKKI